ncbi:hypothetical protein [Amycolatopsis anabasis]|uniref:hypothetical protein n=1 Tax=Amycolatopsis anabasis TaxID=1840409 RepID=UPI003CCD2588
MTDFVRELETQLHGMAKPNDFLRTLVTESMPLGEFGEAKSLSAAHFEAVTEMQGLLDQVKGALTFAQDVTTTVADGYEHADRTVADALRNSATEEGPWG